jgi:hypothetical protein
MIVAVRRALAGLALGLVVAFGAAGTSAHAETPTPTAGATAKATGTAKASGMAKSTASPIVDAGDNGDVTDTPDAAPDNSRQGLALGAAGVLAVLAAVVVFLRRR